MGKPSYLDEEMFVMHRLGGCEFAPKHDLNVINVFNKMHVNCRVRVEWGIGGLKFKWRQLMKRFDSTKGEYIHFFHQ